MALCRGSRREWRHRKRRVDSVGDLFDLSTVDPSEQFYTDIEKHSAQGDECRALYPTPPAPKALARVVYASAFEGPQPVATGWGAFSVAKYVANKNKPRS